jgi:hypothetical protein
MLYRTSTYLTLIARFQLIELSDFVYGEWIIYNKNRPAFHVDVFDEALSNKKVKRLIEGNSETIESILKKINIQQGMQLSLAQKPLLSIFISSQLKDWFLSPLPINWINELS